MTDFSQFKLAVELLSANNTVMMDDAGLPSVMVSLPGRTSRQLCGCLPDSLHPGFLTGEQSHRQVWISKYPNLIYQGRACSLPLQPPGGCVTYDGAAAASRRKGTGWGLTPVSLWSALALEAHRNGRFPRGNNSRGCARHYPEERGVPASWENGSPCETLTGSGPLSWYLGGRASGLSDLVGSVSEWNAGMRLVHGEIQIIPAADVMLPEADLSPNSPWWRAVLPDGSLTGPGARDTLKLDMEGENWKISTRCKNPVDDARGARFRDMFFDPAELPGGVPDILKELSVYPAWQDRERYGEDLVFANNAQAERICLRGGNWSSGKFSGMFYYAMDAKRDRCLPRLGFRSAFYQL